MEIINKDINSITPDKNQPRHTIDMIRVHEMAKSILTEGVINPIEIDEKNIIITGEIRWRSAKESGLKQVPCKIVHYEGRDRFRRQVVENIHHNTMTAMDTAEGLEKLLRMIGWKDSERRSQSYGDKYVTQLAKEIGKSERYLYDYLNLVKESQEIRKYLRTTDAKYSLIRDINKNAPKEFAEELKQKVAKGEITNWHIATELSKALTIAPDKKDELFSKDWSQSKDKDIKEIHKIVPVAERVDDIETLQEGSRAIKYMAELNILFTNHLPEDFNNIGEMETTFTRMVELGKAFFLRKQTIKGELI
jgi:ParB/RepB/Spo0J family partition protein